ncbi:MAG: CehA/McbA family metallohydrolase [Ignavibacteria bacterium]|jgi:hypothetical protein|nr:CehA/McbA family metallohydrolase [Ignavibacteria bacterium]
MELRFAIIAIVLALMGTLNAQGKWFKGNTHTHTTNSDGQFSPGSIIEIYKSKNYDFLVISDHEFITPVSQYGRPDFLLINGEEISFSKHVNGIGISEVINAQGISLRMAINAVKAQHGIPILNHPVWAPTRCYFNDIYSIPELKFMEIFNTSTEPERIQEYLALWDSLLSGNKVIYGVASDDMHELVHVGHGWIQVHALSLLQDSILSAMRRGDFYSSSGIELSYIRFDGKTISISSVNGDQIKFIGMNGKVLAKTEGKSAIYQIYGDESYVRTEISNKNGQMAWTQPIFLKGQNPIELNPITPGEYQIQQNFPNPFNAGTIIDYSLPVESYVKVDVYNILGELVETPVNGREQSGFHEIFISSDLLKSGVYLYQIRAHSLDNKWFYHTIKKMMCIK